MNYLTDFYIDKFFNFMSEESVTQEGCKGESDFFKNSFVFVCVDR